MVRAFLDFVLEHLFFWRSLASYWIHSSWVPVRIHSMSALPAASSLEIWISDVLPVPSDIQCESETKFFRTFTLPKKSSKLFGAAPRVLLWVSPGNLGPFPFFNFRHLEKMATNSGFTKLLHYPTLRLWTKNPSFAASQHRLLNSFRVGLDTLTRAQRMRHQNLIHQVRHEEN